MLGRGDITLEPCCSALVLLQLMCNALLFLLHEVILLLFVELVELGRWHGQAILTATLLLAHHG